VELFIEDLEVDIRGEVVSCYAALDVDVAVTPGYPADQLEPAAEDEAEITGIRILRSNLPPAYWPVLLKHITSVHGEWLDAQVYDAIADGNA
jgi:hypothetical protein